MCFVILTNCRTKQHWHTSTLFFVVVIETNGILPTWKLPEFLIINGFSWPNFFFGGEEYQIFLQRKTTTTILMSSQIFADDHQMSIICYHQQRILLCASTQIESFHLLFWFHTATLLLLTKKWKQKMWCVFAGILEWKNLQNQSWIWSVTNCAFFFLGFFRCFVFVLFFWKNSNSCCWKNFWFKRKKNLQKFSRKKIVSKKKRRKEILLIIIIIIIWHHFSWKFRFNENSTFFSILFFGFWRKKLTFFVFHSTKKIKTAMTVF